MENQNDTLKTHQTGNGDNHPKSTHKPSSELGFEGGLLEPKKTLRWGLSLPLAGLMTLGLALTMAGLIAVEFTPQDKLEVIQADINPVVEDIKTVEPITPPDRFKDIDVPPPPPIIGSPKTNAVYVAPVDTKIVEVDLDLSKLDIGRTAAINVDTEYQPLVRIPPIMPSRAQRSGHCKVRFDVSPQGAPFNVEAVFCSENLFARNTIKSVQQWKYRPKQQGGQALTVQGVENIVRFRLMDERGKLIPERP